MPKLFIPQEWVDHANIEEQITLTGDQMSVKSDGKLYKLTSAVRFLMVEGGDADAHQLVGKVKSEESLAMMGAEMMAESVIHGDTAYRVQPGFLAEFTGSGDPVSGAFK